MKKRQLYVPHLISKYKRYIRKWNRYTDESSLSVRREKNWLKKRIQKIGKKLQLMYAHSSIQTRAAILASGVLLSPAFLNAQTFEEKIVHPFHTQVFETGNISFVDFDGDNDRDFFIWSFPLGSQQAVTEAVEYYENTGSEFKRAPVTGFPEDLGLSELIDTSSLAELYGSFTDFDQDGDQDVFVGASDGEVRYLRNDDGTYTAQIGEDDPFGDFDFASSSKPAFGDLDGDGDIDAVIGSSSGVRIFDNNEGKLDSLTSLSGELDEAVPLLHDFDADGDLDLLVGNKYDDFVYFMNTEGNLEEAELPFSGIKYDAYDGIAFADVDFDGDDEFILARSEGSIGVYEEIADAQYDIRPYNPLGFIVEDDDISPVFTDFDGDGDRDLFLGLDGTMTYHENKEGSFEPAAHPFGATIEEYTYLKPTFVDYDSDGDMDMILGEYDGIQVFDNVDNTFEMISDTLQNPFFKLTEENHQAPAFHDMDGDGDLDLILGNKSGTLEYFVNNEGVFEVAGENPFDGLNFSSYSSPVFVDLDQDGDQDLVVGHNDNISLLVNENNSFTLAESQPFTGFSLFGHVSPGFHDFDGNGTLDVLVGTSLTNRVTYLQNTSEPTSNRYLKDLSHETLVFPNPASSEFLLRATWIKGESALQIVDNLGRTVLEKKIQGDLHRLDISRFAPGQYHLLLANQESRAVVKFVISR